MAYQRHSAQDSPTGCPKGAARASPTTDTCLNRTRHTPHAKLHTQRARISGLPVLLPGSGPALLLAPCDGVRWPSGACPGVEGEAFGTIRNPKSAGGDRSQLEARRARGIVCARVCVGVRVGACRGTASRSDARGCTAQTSSSTCGSRSANSALQSSTVLQGVHGPLCHSMHVLHVSSTAIARVFGALPVAGEVARTAHSLEGT